jgi:hypothetical protein
MKTNSFYSLPINPMEPSNPGRPGNPSIPGGPGKPVIDFKYFIINSK